MPENKIKDITDVFDYFGRDIERTRDYITNLSAVTSPYKLPNTRKLINEVLLGKGTSAAKGFVIVEHIVNHIEREEGVIIPYNNYQEFAVILEGKEVLTEEDIDIYLGREFDYITADSSWKQARERIYNHAIQKKGVLMEQYSSYKHGNIYIGFKNKGILKITGEGTNFQLQGKDNVYIHSHNEFPSKEERKPGSIEKLEDIFDLFTYEGNEKTDKFLLKAWFYFTFLNPSMKTALCITGEPGCGKSFLQKLLKGILIGFHDGVFNPNSMPEEDYSFTLMVKENKHIMLDEVNESTKAMKAKLRMLVTGEEIVFRPKYAKKNVKFKANVWLALSAHSPKFREADIAQRLLIVRLAKIQEQTKLIEESLFMEEMQGSRGLIWDNLTEKLQSILSNLGKNKDRIPLKNYCRQIEMANFAYNAFPEERELCLEAFESFNEIQSQFSAEFDPLMELLATCIEDRTGIGTSENNEVTFTSKELHESMKILAQQNQIKYFPATTHGLAQWISRRNSLLEKDFGYRKQRDTQANSLTHIFKAIKPEEGESF